MIVKKYNSIMQREESYRNKWAIGLSGLFSILIFVSFLSYKGFLGSGKEFATSDKNKNVLQNTASVVVAEKAPSPLESSKKTISSTIDDIKTQYNALKKSLEDVFVPFITGIEVYDKK